MRNLLLVVALVACGKQESAPAQEGSAAGKPAAPPAAPQERQTLEELQIVLPDGWTSTYDAELDKWLLTATPHADGRSRYARIERAAPSAVASPEAFLHQRLRYWNPGTKADIEKREGVKDGFAMTVVVRSAVDRDDPKRETYVVRQLGNVWYQCLSEWVSDDAFRDQLVALCRTLAL